MRSHTTLWSPYVKWSPSSTHASTFAVVLYKPCSPSTKCGVVGLSRRSRGPDLYLSWRLHKRHLGLCVTCVAPCGTLDHRYTSMEPRKRVCRPSCDHKGSVEQRYYLMIGLWWRTTMIVKVISRDDDPTFWKEVVPNFDHMCCDNSIDVFAIIV